MTYAIEALTAVNAELVDTNENLREQNARLVQENAELRGKLNRLTRIGKMWAEPAALNSDPQNHNPLTNSVYSA